MCLGLAQTANHLAIGIFAQKMAKVQQLLLSLDLMKGVSLKANYGNTCNAVNAYPPTATLSIADVLHFSVENLLPVAILAIVEPLMKDPLNAIIIRTGAIIVKILYAADAYVHMHTHIHTRLCTHTYMHTHTHAHKNLHKWMNNNNQ